MKTISLFVVVLMTLMSFGCASSQETRLALEPRSYDEAMTWIRDEVAGIDKAVIGAQYGEAVPDAERLREYTKWLTSYEPPRLPNDYEVYDEYFNQTQDLFRCSDRLLYFIEQRRKQDAKDQLAEFARRYNRLSTTFGPNWEISVLERGPEEFRTPEYYRGDVPGELRGNR
ncbi:MAG: hypothetical protein H6841_05880 [Planctomycetes bacterium]|nr:hypothetical protein [Planctomycetota bacterium]MCB9934315.1 hypothetical protein [Planctomycetota bacterium]